MVQEDKGLVIRGLVLLALISGLVVFVLALLFWRPQESAKAVALDALPECYVSAVVGPALTHFPAGISWGAMYAMKENLPSAPGFGIRYNAATTLARRGSASVPWHLIREMLDEKQQLRNYRVRQSDGVDAYDKTAARSNAISALKALTAWHEVKKTANTPSALPPELREIYALVDALAEKQDGEVKAQAEKAQQTFLR